MLNVAPFHHRLLLRSLALATALGPAAFAAVPETAAQAPDALPLVWRSNLERGLQSWPGQPKGWGLENRQFDADLAIQGQALRVFIARGSIDPASMRLRGQPFGGTGFKMRLPGPGHEVAQLRYKVRFPHDFQQGRGGKLPGLCGGACNGGGKMPDGRDGFSARYMWTGNFAASVYAYLPSSIKYGTPIGSRQIPLERGRWIELVQELKLNTPDQADGHIKVWADGVQVVDQQGLAFRTVDQLKIDAIYFDVFYGGNDDTWAAPQDTTIEFAEFMVSGR